MKNTPKIVSLVALFGLTLGMTLQASHGMDGWTENPDLNPTLQASTKATSLKRVPLTSITKRCEILGNYYRDDINNPDPSVYIHLAKWHNQDTAAIRQKITNPDNLAILNQHHNAMNQSFSEGSASYLKIATNYYNYGLILSREVNASAIPENQTLKGVNELCQSDTNLIKIDSSEESTDESSGDDLDVLSDFCSMGFKCLPFVSTKGIASFRAINESFGIGIPIIGLPLGRASYDGIMNADPSTFFSHDVNHLIFNDYDINKNILSKIYNIYRDLNKVISKIENIKKQVLCDVFLFEFGHEQDFDLNSKKADIGTENISNSFIDANTFYAACDKITNELKTNLLQFNLPQNINDLKNKYNIKFHEDSIPGSVISEQFVHYNALESLKHPETGNKICFIGIINDFKIDKNRPLFYKDFEKALNINLSENSYVNEDNDMNEDYDSLKQTIQSYNSLLGLEGYLENHGLDFKIWKGDQLNLENLCAFYDLIGETFKREVGSKLYKEAALNS